LDDKDADGDIINMCKGVILLGTPNRGTRTFDTQGSLLAAIAASSATLEDPEQVMMQPHVLSDLQDMEGDITDTSSRFARVCVRSGIRVVCFYEQMSSPVAKLVQGSQMPPVGLIVFDISHLFRSLLSIVYLRHLMEVMITAYL
jgi:hypothetical protein